jgi:putative IMPACT (imprinted ancient) family translation regulator
MVVTRYFGGTKLGRGGLVRAYSDAARGVLSVLPRARKVSTHTVEITAPYSYFERLRLLVGDHDGQILGEEFTAEVIVAAQLAVERFPGFEAALREMSKGSLTANILDTDGATIMPIPTDG